MKMVLNSLLFPFSTAWKSYKILLAITVLIPILFSIYFMISMKMKGVTFSEYLYQDAWNNAQFLVALLDFAWAYILLALYENMKNEKRLDFIGFILWTMLISQIAVSNILLAMVTGITLYKMKVKLQDVMKISILLQNKKLSILAISLLLFSLFGGFAFVRLAFF